jgi:hypothetical protein
MDNCLVMQDQLTCHDADKEEEEVEEEIIDNKLSLFFNGIQGLEAARKYAQQFAAQDDIILTGSKLEKKLRAMDINKA